MKCDPISVTICTALFVPLSGVLCLIPSRVIRIFSISLAGISVFDLLNFWIGIAEPVWWLMHLPSTIALGADEILERHGIFLGTVGHVSDLIILATILTAAIFIAFLRQKNIKIVAQQDKFSVRGNPRR